jgi:hypothetical protein
MNTQITISHVTIQQDTDGRFCLNDLHKAAGNENKHRPSLWLQNKQAIELIAEIEKAGIPAIQSKQQLGTFAVKPLVYAYAMWISPAFHLAVINAYDALVTGQIPDYLKPITAPISVAKFEQRHSLLTQALEALRVAPVYAVMTGEEWVSAKIATNTQTEKPKVKIVKAEGMRSREKTGIVFSYKHWTKEELQTLREGFQSGLKDWEIAQKLGRSTSSVEAAWLRHRGEV